MKSAKKQQKRKAHYMGDTHSSLAYTGSRTQPGYAGLPAGRKLGQKAARNRLDGRAVGVVSKALENIAKGKRVSA